MCMVKHKLGAFHVYQCDLEALVDLFKEHVIVSCALSTFTCTLNTAVVFQTALPVEFPAYGAQHSVPCL